MSSLPTPPTSAPHGTSTAHGRSKTIAAWLALVVGALGVHRFYLHGFKDKVGWLFPLPTFVGILGVHRMEEFGQDDRAAWVMIQWLGLSLAAAMLTAIRYGLTPDERWDARFNASRPSNSGWVAIIAVILAVLLGGGILMATIAFTSQRYFEYTMGDDNPLR